MKLRLLGMALGTVVETINAGFSLLDIYASRDEIIKRRMKRIQQKSLKDVKVGEYVKLVGKAQPYDRMFVAPLSRKECVAYQTWIDRETGNEDTEVDDHYVTEEILHRFYLKDGDDEILVLGNDARAHLKLIFKEDSGILGKASDEVKAFLKKHGYSAKSFGIRKSLEASERILEKDQEVAVIGNVSVLNTRHDGKLLVLRGTEKNPLYIKV